MRRGLLALIVGGVVLAMMFGTSYASLAANPTPTPTPQPTPTPTPSPTKSNNPTITFVSPSPTEGQTLTTDSVSFKFTYNRTTKQTKSLKCALVGPTPSAAADCAGPKTSGSTSTSENNNYSGLANGDYTFTASLTLTDGGTASATRHFTVAVVHAPVLTVTKDNDADHDGTYSDTETVPAGSTYPYTVTYKVTMSNSSGSSAATISSITDDKVAAPLRSASTTDTDCADVIGTSIASGGTVTCYYDGTFATTPLSGQVVNTVTVTLTNNAGSDTKTNTSTVNFESGGFSTPTPTPIPT